MGEIALQRKILDHCKRHQILALNIHQSGWTGKGFPDLILCLDGRFVALELKVGTNKPSKIQERWGEKIKKAGGIHAVIYTFEEFLDILSELTARNSRKQP